MLIKSLPREACLTKRRRRAGRPPAPHAIRALALAALAGPLPSCVKNPAAPFQLKQSETFYSRLKKEPESLHPIRGKDYYSAVLHYYTLESLLTRGISDYEWQPGLAEKWEISPDGKTFTFYLYENLKWSDGRPLTVRDVQFSFEAHKSPEYGGLRRLPHFESIEAAEIISSRAIAFRAREPYFGNFPSLAEAKIIPRHIYQNPQTRLSRTVIGSGPYKIARYDKGKMIALTQNPLWSGRARPHNKGKWLFKNIVFRFAAENSDALLGLQKGRLDFSFISPEDFERRTSSPPWGRSIKKYKVSNKLSRGYSFIGLNLKNPLFQDRRARTALAHLMNRKLMSEKFAFGHLQPAAGPWHFWSDFADPSVRPLAFDPKKAARLLRAAGWKDENQDGVLEKPLGGKKTDFSFTALFSGKDSEKFLTLYQAELKKAGVDMRLKLLDLPALVRAADEGSFEAAAWTRSLRAIDFDPKLFWHSDSARKGGYNFIGYSSPKADALMEKGRRQLNRAERVKTFRRLYRLIAEDAPCIFMFHSRSRFYGVRSRIRIPRPVFNYGIGQEYWSMRQPPGI